MQISNDLFKPLDRHKLNKNNIVRPGISFRKNSWLRLKSNKVAMMSFIGIIALFFVAAIGPYLIPYTYDGLIKGDEGQPPSWKHPFGTDLLGRDMFARVLFGTRISLSVGVVASIINLTIGVFYGGISGYFGGRTDNIMMRIVDILDSIPLTLYIILLMVIFREYGEKLFDIPVLSLFKDVGASLISMYIALGCTYWLGMARIVRAQMLSLKEMEYVVAAKALGAGHFRVLSRYLIPNAAGTIIVTTMLQIPSAIFAESFLSFLGLGVSLPVPSLGSLAAEALGGIRSYFYLLLYPSLAISFIMLAFNLFGDGLRDAMDPRVGR